MTKDEIKHGILRVCKVAGWDSDFNVVGFHALCDALVNLGAEEAREASTKLVEDKKQAEIDALYALYKQACEQRDALMDQQRAQIEAMRGRIQ